MTRTSRSAVRTLATLGTAMLLVVEAFAQAPASSTSGNWPRFRGPGGHGRSPETGLPLRWDSPEALRWRTPLPGPGHSSPIVWNDRVFVTAYRPPEGLLRRYFTSSGGRLFVLCLDATTGRPIWEREIEVEAIEDYHSTNSPASPTPVTDGTHVFVHFGSYGLICLDLDGNVVWRKPLGPFPNTWGSASSPVLHGDTLLLNSDTDADDFLLAVDKRTGATRWRTSRSNVERSWPTPTVWAHGGREEVVVSGSRRVTSYDLATGRELWTVDGLTHWVSPTPVIGHGLLFVASNGPGGNVVMAIRPGGRGNVTSSHVVWRHRRGAPYTSSPILVGDRLFMVKNGGIMSCLDARSGELVWRERLPARGSYYASPVAAEGRLYVINEDGEMTVVRAGSTFEVLASSDLGERTMASPAISNRCFFVRTDAHLLAIGDCRASGSSAARPPITRP